MGRRRKAPPPACPQGHRGVVYLHGTRARRGDGRFARPRYRCTPLDANGDPLKDAHGKKLWHTFTLPRRAPTTIHPDGEICTNCEHKLERGDGVVALPSYSFALTELASVAEFVGQGRSLRESSQEARKAAGLATSDQHGRTWTSRQNALAADYLDAFGPIIVRAMTPRRWPRIVVLDSIPLGIRPRTAHDNGYPTDREGGAVLVAAGRERFQPRTRTWLTTLAGDETEASWVEFLQELESDPAPFWVVADGAKAIRNAVWSVWPTAIFYPCEFHLRERATHHATADGRQKEPAVVKGIEAAFYGLEHWERLGEIAKGEGPSSLWQWWVRTDPDARRMVELKARYAGYPVGNGAAEWAALAIRERIGDRKKNFLNADRLATVIALMGIHTSEQSSAQTYSKLLRAQFERLGWQPGDPWPGHDWEDRHDRATGTPSLDELIFEAWRADDAAHPSWGNPAQVSASVIRKVAAVNVLRRAKGVPPLSAETKANSRSAVVVVKGKKLGEFPELLDEWDRELNDDPDPRSLPAGSGKKAHWVCSRGHHWETRIVHRTMRLTGCPRCKRSWANDENSITALKPAVLPEWDEQRNAPRGPEAVKASSTAVFWWKCLERPDHPSYRTSPRSRIRLFDMGRNACPICRATAYIQRQSVRPHDKKSGTP